MKTIKIIEQDIIFLSYNEPNAEKNYADLLAKVPWAKRVHGVKGSDAAHKACAKLSETEYFTTVDGDNIIDPKYLEVEIEVDGKQFTDENVFSWAGNVHVNGLKYGNGGLKLWTRKFVNEMKTHENSNPNDIQGKVEFCFDQRYYQFNECYSESFTNATPEQAWRAGFREGVKMCLVQGARVTNTSEIWWQNYHRLLIWSSVGADVENGIWSILGAREGAYKTLLTDWDYANVRDFDWLSEFWNETHGQAEPEEMTKYINFLAQELRDKSKLEIANLDSAGSKFFKTVYSPTPRSVRKKY
jgi:hypothetical protein